MSDIRNFFGGNGSTKKANKRSAPTRIIIDSDDEEPSQGDTEITRSKSAQVTPAEFFGNNKITRSTKTLRSKKVDDQENFDMPDLDIPQTLERAQQIPIDVQEKNAKDYQAPTGTAFKSDPQQFTNMKRKHISDEVPISSSPPESKKRAKTSQNNVNTPKSSPVADSAQRTVRNKKTAQEFASVEDIMSAVPTIELPSIDTDIKFQYGQAPATASAPGSKVLPDGAEDCLAGLTFVFTGVLESLERTEAVDLVKSYGGRITTAPSKNTSFVVLGEQAGPSKIKKIKALGVRAIDENGLLQLIATMPVQGGDSKSAQKAMEKKQSQDLEAQAKAAEMERAESELQKENEQKMRLAEGAGQQARIVSVGSQLWTTKYAPVSIKDVIGNKGNVEKLSRFLNDWPKNVKSNFKKPGPDGLGLYRAILISGPPGIGKTTSAHLAAKLAGLDVLEFNASDTRSKRLLDEGLKDVINNTSLNGYFSTEGKPVDQKKKQLVLIMDEVDGMSAGDRGGVGALNAVIRKTTIPIICICNDRSSQKLKPLEKTTFDLRFSKPTKEQVRSRIMSIAFKEKMQIQPIAIDQLVEGTGSDIRQIINLLSTYRLTMQSMDQDQGRNGAKSAEKHVILKPWDIVSKLLNGAIYGERSTTTLNEKIELYFNDHELSYLMLQENYLNTNPDRARTTKTPKEHLAKRLFLASGAASAISDGDLVDSMIHGSQQHWSLMPVHAVFSCVRPASLIAGPGTARMGFTMVLGNMSRLGKANRLLRELRSHLRLKTSADRLEIRRDYIPVLFERLPRALSLKGMDAIPLMIEDMDEYYLNREDYDNLLELGIGDNNRDKVEAMIPSGTKSAFTRQYNKVSHPVAFIPHTSSLPAKKISAGEAPDFEDAVELSEDEVEIKDLEETPETLDLKNDKVVSAPKSKRATQKSKKSAASSKGR